jgi:Flp pilus assembly protein TadG
MMYAFIKRFRKAKSGMAAAEFALIVPVMVAFFFGMAELGDYILAARKVANISSTAADLTSQTPSVTNAEMNEIMNALAVIIRPLDPSTSTIRISSIVADNQGRLSVRWSDARRTSAYNAGSAAPSWVPTNIVPANQSVIVAEVTLRYQTLFGMYLTSGITISDNFFLKPRRSVEVARLP